MVAIHVLPNVDVLRSSAFSDQYGVAIAMIVNIAPRHMNTRAPMLIAVAAILHYTGFSLNPAR